MSNSASTLIELCRSGPHVDVEIALVRGALDGVVEIELVGRAGAREFAQAAQRDLDVARAELDLVVEVLELALVPHLHGAAVLAFSADADAFGIVARVAERRGAGGADPFLAALVAALLLFEPLLQGLEQLVEAAHRLDHLLLFLGEIFLRELLQPLGGDLGGERLLEQVEPLEHVAEHAVELVEVALVLHQRGAREIVEVLDPAAGEVLLHRFHQGQVFAQRDRHAGGFQLGEEGDEHGGILAAVGRESESVSGRLAEAFLQKLRARRRRSGPARCRRCCAAGPRRRSSRRPGCGRASHRSYASSRPSRRPDRRPASGT